MKRTAMQHTKLRRLVRVLKVPQYAAVGILESLWHLTAREAPFGDIGRLTNDDIADWIGWDRENSELIDGLVECGWLDKDETSRLLVHDWEEHADDTTKKAIARQREKDAGQNPPKPQQIDGSPVLLSGNVQTAPDKSPLPFCLCLCLCQSQCQSQRTKPPFPPCRGRGCSRRFRREGAKGSPKDKSACQKLRGCCNCVGYAGVFAE